MELSIVPKPPVLDIEYTPYGNCAIGVQGSSVLLAPVTTQRDLRFSRVLKWYSKYQLSTLLNRKQYNNVASSNKFKESFKELEATNRKNNKIHKWTELEDNFLKNNYQYLSDNTIALALNMPANRVQNRRGYLGLRKEQQPKEDTLVIVWDNRNKFESDLEVQGLSLLRAGIR